ncbi:GNAT family N-acetyltransferase [Longimicrobium sp.]|uniref:GNAT family N-acetyltransferase n=1 Tax=Longimicrobium sp. TaxID=2029185 RepID=UPI003B3A38E3
MSEPVRVRVATEGDLAAIRELIPRSVRGLSVGYYTPREVESSIRYVFGPDTQLIADGTYFVAESGGEVAGCGGWSARRTLYGGDQAKDADDPRLDPATEAARIRAFFVHPDHARRGIASAIYEACVAAARAAGFRSLELMATLPGEPLYRTFGFHPVEQVESVLPDGVPIRFVRMRRDIEG